MSIRRSFQPRRPITPPKENLYSNVVGRFLDPLDGLIAIFFAILFALLFTLSYGILINRGVIEPVFASGYGQELFWAILGAVTAWGLIDAVIYILSGVFARRQRYRLLQYIQTSSNDEYALEAIADELDFILEPISSDNQREALYEDILAHLSQAEPQATGLKREDMIGAVATVILSVVAVLPSLLPLLLLEDTALALRVSNFVSFVVVFVAGYAWGVYAGSSPWKTGLLLSLVCLSMVLVAFLLGG